MAGLTRQASAQSGKVSVYCTLHTLHTTTHITHHYRHLSSMLTSQCRQEDTVSHLGFLDCKQLICHWHWSFPIIMNNCSPVSNNKTGNEGFEFGLGTWIKAP